MKNLKVETPKGVVTLTKYKGGYSLKTQDGFIHPVRPVRSILPNFCNFYGPDAAHRVAEQILKGDWIKLFFDKKGAKARAAYSLEALFHPMFSPEDFAELIAETAKEGRLFIVYGMELPDRHFLCVAESEDQAKREVIEHFDISDGQITACYRYNYTILSVQADV